MSRYIQIPAPLEFYLDPDSLIYPIDTDEEEAAAKAAMRKWEIDELPIYNEAGKTCFKLIA